MGDATCTEDDCDNPPRRKTGPCNKHYLRELRDRRKQRQCSIEGCTEGVHMKEWCVHHYLNWRQRGDPLAENPNPPYRIPEGAVCSVPDCRKPVYARGWCLTCYQRWYARPDRSDPAERRYIVGDELASFWAKVNQDGPIPERRPELGPCWVWTGGLDTHGYGSFAIKGHTQQAYHYSYVLAKGPIPSGLEVDHLCMVITCVNPDHLEAVTKAVNIQRRWQAWREALDGKCVNGHERTPENTYVSHMANGEIREACRECSLDSQRRYKERKKASGQ